MARSESQLELAELDLAHLGLFVGQRMNERVLERLHALGFEKLRVSHGYVVQHVIGADRPITELARRMGVTQQAASKVVRELVSLGYVELGPGEDARQRLVRLSARGKAALTASRRIRAELLRKALKGQTDSAVAAALSVLTVALERLESRTG